MSTPPHTRTTRHTHEAGAPAHPHSPGYLAEDGEPVHGGDHPHGETPDIQNLGLFSVQSYALMFLICGAFSMVYGILA